MSLRKTCHDMRNTIEDLKPGPSELQFLIQLKKDTLDFNIRWPVPLKTEDSRWKRNRQGHQVLATEDTLHLIYQKVAPENFWREKSCQVTCELPDLAVPVRTKILKSSNFLEVFSNDLKTILEHQKDTVLFKKFILIAEKDCEKKTRKLYENLKQMFKAKQFKIQDLRLHTFEEQGIFSILPYLDAEKLKQITITNALDINGQEKLDRIEELMNLEQWKKSEDLMIFGFSHPLRIENYFHFISLGIRVPTIHTRDVVAMKDNMLAGSALQTGCIYFETIEDDWRSLNELLGRNRLVPDPEFPMGAVWEIPVPGEESAILILFNDGYISFQKIKVAVPANPGNPGNPGGFFGNPGGALMFGGRAREPENPEDPDDDDDL